MKTRNVFRLHACPAGQRTAGPIPVSNFSHAAHEARRMYRLLRRAGVEPWLARHALVTMLVCGGSAAATFVAMKPGEMILPPGTTADQVADALRKYRRERGES